MSHTIKTFSPYNPRQFGIPWGAPCNTAGRPNFKGKVAHYTGSNGSGGDLFVEDPAENSVWVFGQKDYRTHTSSKEYAVFQAGSFHPISEAELCNALSAAPAPDSTEKRKNKLLRILFNELLSAEKSNRVPQLLEIMERRGITHEEAEKYGALHIIYNKEN